MNGDDRREQSAKLGRAIAQHIDSEDLLGDWLVVACTVGVDDAGDPVAQYHLAFSNGSMLDHHALGLLGKAEDLLTDPIFRDNDE